MRGLGIVPVAEHEATCEGEQEEDDREDQFKLLVFVLVGKSVLWRKTELRLLRCRREGILNLYGDEDSL